MSVGKICNRAVVTIAPEVNIRDAASRMAENQVGSLVVLDSELRPIGILTDRDIAVRCVAEGLNPEVVHVSELMTTPIRTIKEATPIEEGLATMASAGVRRIVITDANAKLLGILALDDILELFVEEAESIGKLLRENAQVGAGA